MDSSSPTSPLSNKRKVNEKRAVRVKVVEKKGDDEQIKNGSPPPDSWAWRKYGQKPIRGSPYPRSYYRCSTVKGCAAKKQVERCKDDASVLIITYTSAHNHHGLESTTRNKKQNHPPKKKAHTEQAQAGDKGKQQSQLHYMQSNEGDEWFGKVEKEEAYMVNWDSFNPGTSSNSVDNLGTKGKKEHKSFGMSRIREDSCEELELFDDELMSFMTWASPLPHLSLP